MNKSVRFIGLSVSSLLFMAFFGYVIPNGVHAQVSCPCNYNSIPTTTQCWVDPFGSRDVIYSNTDDPTLCQASNIGEVPPGPPPQPIPLINVNVNADLATCRKDVKLGGPQCGRGTRSVHLTPEEVIACQCELLAYVTALNDVDGITVSGGPPYACGDVECTQPNPPTEVKTPIPTLSEWGLIAMACILGIFGFMIMRRRKLSTN